MAHYTVTFAAELADYNIDVGMVIDMDQPFLTRTNSAKLTRLALCRLSEINESYRVR